MPDHSPPPAILIARQGSYAGKRAVITQTPYTIGRDARCQLHPPDPDLAPLHAVIHTRDGVYYVQDRGSAGGTLVNGRPVKTARLQPGDCLRVGSLELEFQLKTQPAIPGKLKPAVHPAPLEDDSPAYPAAGLGYSIIPSRGASASLYGDDDPITEAPMPPPARKSGNPWVGRLYMAALLAVGFLVLAVVLPDMLGTNVQTAPPPGFNSSSGATVLYFYADW